MSEGCQRNWGPTRSADINILQRSDYFTDRCSFGLACGVLRLWCGGHLCCDSMVLLLLIGPINILESINLNPKLWALIVRQLHEVMAVLAFTDRNHRIVTIPNHSFWTRAAAAFGPPSHALSCFSCSETSG
jgi:hypothetical protein